jgi:hypothetical protein
MGNYWRRVSEKGSRVLLGLAVGLLVVGLLTWRPILARAQTPGPDPLEDLTDPVTDVVEETAEALQETTETIAQDVENNASSTIDPDTGIEAGGFDAGGSGGSGSGAAGSSADTNSDPAGGGSATTGGGSGRTTAAAEIGGRQGSRSAPAHDQQVGDEFDPSYPVSSLVVSKTNDANRDGVFSDPEAAPSLGAAVSFRVEITNVGDVELTITDVRDAIEDGRGGFVVPVCEDLIGDQLPPKVSVGCSFTLKDYAPEERGKVNTLQVIGVETVDPSTVMTGRDTSTVLGSNVGVLGKVATNQLATTGAQIVSLLKAFLGFMIAGTLLVAAGRVREEAILGSARIGGSPTPRRRTHTARSWS